MAQQIQFDVVVVGGGPAGATAATRLAEKGARVMLLDREGRIKPCGGAIPSVAMAGFNIAPSQIKARIRGADMIGPSGRLVAMEIGDVGHVGMVDRDVFDPWLRERAALTGADYRVGTFRDLERNADGTVSLSYVGKDGIMSHVRTLLVVGADGANSAVRRAVFGPEVRPPYVFAYHEIVEAPKGISLEGYDPARCQVIYDGRISPDFYGWVFPHGEQVSIGTGTAVKGFDLKAATRELRRRHGLEGARTIREEGAPLPLKPMRKWDDGKNVVLCGDAAGVVAPSSGEGIYYAMHTGDLAADAVLDALKTGDARKLAGAQKRFRKAHGRVFMILGFMQYFWYRNDKRRELFVKLCADDDVQKLTWESYLTKKIVRRDPMAHIRVALKDTAHLLGLRKRTS